MSACHRQAGLSFLMLLRVEDKRCQKPEMEKSDMQQWELYAVNCHEEDLGTDICPSVKNAMLWLPERSLKDEEALILTACPHCRQSTRYFLSVGIRKQISCVCCDEDSRQNSYYLFNTIAWALS